MRRFTALLAVLLAGCGGGSHHHPPNLRAAGQAATGSVHPPGWGQAPPGTPTPAPVPLTSSAAPTAEMFDTVTLATVPVHPFALAGYTSGYWPTYLPLRARWPKAHTISIAISWGYRADCLDLEPRDAVPAQAGAWALADIRAGHPHPCLYSDLSEMPAVKASLAAALGPNWRSHVLLWLAWYRYVAGLVAGYDAVQWTDHALSRNLDESTVTLDFLRAAQPPYTPAPLYPRCYTHRLPATGCVAVKAQVTRWWRASVSSRRAYLARGCDVLTQRERWFAGRIRTQPRSPRLAYRRGALTATRRALSTRQCQTFAGRVAHFDALARQAIRTH